MLDAAQFALRRRHRGYDHPGDLTADSLWRLRCPHIRLTPRSSRTKRFCRLLDGRAARTGRPGLLLRHYAVRSRGPAVSQSQLAKGSLPVPVSARHHFPGAWLARVARFRNLHDRDGTKWGLCGRLAPAAGVARVRCAFDQAGRGRCDMPLRCGRARNLRTKPHGGLPSDKSLVELASDAQYERRRLEELLDCEFSYVQRARSATTT
jgi:hypothetical protein